MPLLEGRKSRRPRTLFTQGGASSRTTGLHALVVTTLVTAKGSTSAVLAVSQKVCAGSRQGKSIDVVCTISTGKRKDIESYVKTRKH